LEGQKGEGEGELARSKVEKEMLKIKGGPALTLPEMCTGGGEGEREGKGKRGERLAEEGGGESAGRVRVRRRRRYSS